jgi:hypothetical protein
MKLNTLRSIGHNIADSLASGIGMMIGLYAMDVFGEARRSLERYIEVDFLAGASTGGRPSPYLARAIALYRDALPGLCERQGARLADFGVLRARYSGGLGSGQFAVTLEDSRGRRAIDRYVGVPGRRVRKLDHLGRVRPEPGRIIRIVGQA